jgi:translation elongation factor P/translation initiation factor 5A
MSIFQLLAEEISHTAEGKGKAKIHLDLKDALRNKVLEVLDRYKNGKDVIP